MSERPALFDRVFQRYMRHNAQAHTQSLRQWEEDVLVSMIPEECVRSKHVFSIGCGTATDVDLMYWPPEKPAKNGWSVAMGMASFAGIDPARQRVEAAQRRHWGRHGVRVVCQGIESLDVMQFGAARYGLVFSRLALHWVEDAEAAAKKAYELLEPGGAFVFSVEHPDGPERGCSTFMDEPCVRYHRGAVEWRDILEAARFQDIAIRADIYDGMSVPPYLFVSARKR